MSFRNLKIQSVTSMLMLVRTPHLSHHIIYLDDNLGAWSGQGLTSHPSPRQGPFQLENGSPMDAAQLLGLTPGVQIQWTFHGHWFLTYGDEILALQRMFLLDIFRNTTTSPGIRVTRLWSQNKNSLKSQRYWKGWISLSSSGGALGRVGTTELRHEESAVQSGRLQTPCLSSHNICQVD